MSHQHSSNISYSHSPLGLLTFLPPFTARKPLCFARLLLSSNIMGKCNHVACEKKEVKLSLCSGCNKVQYCSRECQKADWSSHKEFCKKRGPTLGHMEREVKQSHKKGVPICLLCNRRMELCTCDKKDKRDGIVFSMTDRPLTFAERDKNFQKWVKKMTSMKSKFAAAQFYQDFSKQGLVKTIMKVEELLKFMMREYTDGSYHVGCGIKMDLLEDFPPAEKLTYGSIAVSKLVDCAFRDMGKLEILVCKHMYITVRSSEVPPIVAQDLQKVYDLIIALDIATQNTPNWPDV